MQVTEQFMVTGPLTGVGGGLADGRRLLDDAGRKSVPLPAGVAPENDHDGNTLVGVELPKVVAVLGQDGQKAVADGRLFLVGGLRRFHFVAAQLAARSLPFAVGFRWRPSTLRPRIATRWRH